MPIYSITCRGVLRQPAIDQLVAAGIAWFTGGPAHAGSKWHLHHLRVEAIDSKSAMSRVRELVREAGADGFHLTLVGETSAEAAD